jgi:O-antigen ligase
MTSSLSPDPPAEPNKPLPTGPLPTEPTGPLPAKPSAGQTLAAMWLYTLLRFGLFGLLWFLLWLARVPGLLAGLIALVLSVPLSYVLLRRQRERMADNLEQRVLARQAKEQELDARLSGRDQPEP